MSLPSVNERKSLIPLLQQLNQTVEDLLLSGLGAASANTRQSLAVSFQAASSKKLLRLGSTLRVAVEEIGRYSKNDALFSRRRYSFFLNRAWMLCQGMLHALENDNLDHWLQLTARPSGKSVADLKVITLGVMKRVVPNAFVAFEFRLRSIDRENTDIPYGSRLIWSHIFPMQSKTQVPPEAYLHLPFPQKFKGADFLQGKAINIDLATMNDNRISLLPQSQVTLDKELYSDWQPFLTWDMGACLARLQHYQAGPFDLEVDLQEEIVLTHWQIGDAEEVPREQTLFYPIDTAQGRFYCPVSVDDETLIKIFKELRNKKSKNKPALFGLLHYEMCRLIFQPLSLVNDKGPDPLMLSKKKFNPAELIKSLRFT